MKLLIRGKFKPAAAYSNYFLMLVNIAGIIFLALNYQKLFEHFSSAVTALIALVTSLLFLLTGKKNFEIKNKTFFEIFSSPITWIPNIIIAVCITWLLLGILNPIQYKIKIHFIREWNDEMFFQQVPVRGKGELYAVLNNSNKLISVRPINDSLDFKFNKIDSAETYYVKLNLENKYNRLLVENDSLQFSLDSNLVVRTMEVHLKIMPIKINIPSHIAKAEFIDQTGFGRMINQSSINDSNINIANGYYEYVLKDFLGNDRFFGNITINVDNLSNGELRLPLNSTDVTIAAGGGYLRVKGENYLSTVDIKTSRTLRLLNDVNYEYFLNGKYYEPRNGIFSAKDVDINSSIKFALNEKKKIWVKFNTKLPGGYEIPADISIDGKDYGTSDKPKQIEAGYYNRIHFTYTDTVSNNGEKFIYEAHLNNLDLFEDSYEFPVVLKLK